MKVGIYTRTTAGGGGATVRQGRAVRSAAAAGGDEMATELVDEACSGTALGRRRLASRGGDDGRWNTVARRWRDGPLPGLRASLHTARKGQVLLRRLPQTRLAPEPPAAARPRCRASDRPAPPAGHRL